MNKTPARDRMLAAWRNAERLSVAPVRRHGAVLGVSGDAVWHRGALWFPQLSTDPEVEAQLLDEPVVCIQVAAGAENHLLIGSAEGVPGRRTSAAAAAFFAKYRRPADHARWIRVVPLQGISWRAPDVDLRRWTWQDYADLP